ncbi:hypothetical protein AMTR_s00072p00174730 [Amborella trichopoda]|uniref:Uncharacterized protein n=1 Tax=Amborella trichopoda TaxID=13333 RepID=W1NRI9_AMBTC|nr:hypothetical protein AMTR_s00072p00174730 [Amborella trichopoda]
MCSRTKNRKKGWKHALWRLAERERRGREDCGSEVHRYTIMRKRRVRRDGGSEGEMGAQRRWLWGEHAHKDEQETRGRGDDGSGTYAHAGTSRREKGRRDKAAGTAASG